MANDKEDEEKQDRPIKDEAAYRPDHARPQPRDGVVKAEELKKQDREIRPQREQETIPMQRIVTVEHPVEEPQQQPENLDKKPRFHLIKFLNSKLNFAIGQSADGKTLTLFANGQELTIVSGKPPLMKDHTGRTMVRVLDPIDPTKEKLYDPLSGRLLALDKRNPQPIAEQVNVVAPEKYAEKISTSIAEKLDEEVRVPQAELAKNAIFLMKKISRDELGDALAGKRAAFIYSVEIDESDEDKESKSYKTVEVHTNREQTQEKAAAALDEAIDDLGNSKVTLNDYIPGSADHAVFVGDRVEPVEEMRQVEEKVDNDRVIKSPMEVAEGLRSAYERGAPILLNYQDDTLRDAVLPYLADPNPDIQRFAQTAYNVATSGDTVSPADARDELRDIAADLRRIPRNPVIQPAINVLDTAIREGRGRATAQANAEQPQRRGQGDDEEADENRAYYKQQLGNIDRPTYIGFERTPVYMKTQEQEGKRILINEVAKKGLAEEYREIHVEKYQEFQNLYLQVQAVIADIVNREEEGHDDDPGEKVQIRFSPTRENREVVLNAQGEVSELYLEYRDRHGHWHAFPDELRFSNDGTEQNRKRLIVAQYVELKFRQQRWLKEQLEEVALLSSTEKDAEHELGKITRSRENFLDDDIDNQYRAFNTLFQASRAFMDRGSDGLNAGAEAFNKVAHILINLPGVAEILTELDRREFDSKIDMSSGRPVAKDERHRGSLANKLRLEKKYDELWLTGIRDFVKPTGREDYYGVRTSIIKAAGRDYDWRVHAEAEINDQIAELERQEGQTDEIKAAIFHLKVKRQDIATQEIDQSSMEVAEWIWRMFGRGAFFGDTTGKGQYDMNAVSNLPYFAINKDKGYGDEEMYLTAFGAPKKDDGSGIAKLLPGMGSQEKGHNLHTGWYGFIADYAVLMPGGNIKGALVDAGIEKYVSEEDQALVSGIIQEWKDRRDQAKKSRFRGARDNEDEWPAAGLTPAENRALMRWNNAPVFRVGIDSWRKIRRNEGVWNDWVDYGRDFKKAEAANKVLLKFIADPTFKNIEPFSGEDALWARGWRSAEGTMRGLNTLIEYRAEYNKKNKNKPNIDGDDIDFIITSARKKNMIDDTMKEELENEQLGDRIRGPVLPFAKKRLFHLNASKIPDKILGFPLKRLIFIWPAKYKTFLFKLIREAFGGFFTSLGKTWQKGIKPPK